MSFMLNMSRLVSISDISIATPRDNNSLSNIADNIAKPMDNYIIANISGIIAAPMDNYSLDNLSLNCGEELTEQDWDTVAEYRWVGRMSTLLL